MSSPRVAVIGARRAQAGLGRFLCRHLVTAGAEIAGIVGTSAASREQAVRDLASDGIEVAAHASLTELARVEQPDAVVIASPAPTHADLLAKAADLGLHVLCEKPFVWGTGDDPATAAELAARFEDAGLTLVENVIWPYTLGPFEALHPGSLDRVPRRFEMWMSPSQPGAEFLLRECMSHPLSLLQALVPGRAPTLADVEFSTADAGTGTLRVRFGYCVGTTRVAVTVALDVVRTQPRPAGYAIDGARADRSVRMSDYALSFGDGTRTVPVPDPMVRLVADFVRAVRNGTAPEHPCVSQGIADRARLMAELMHAFDTAD